VARARTGQLIWRKSGWYARLWTIVDGERVRVCRALGTTNRAVAKRKLERLLAAENGATEDAKRPETFAEAAERVYAARLRDAGDYAKGPRQEIAQLRRYALPIIGHMSCTDVQPIDVNAVLDHAKGEGLNRQSVQHLRQRLSNVFGQLRRDGVRRDNPVADAEMPRFSDQVLRERAVLNDVELAIYLAWEHPHEHYRSAVRERQTMACVARMFGGLRTGDLHALRWEAFDTEGGAFTWGYAPRQKTRRPQLLEVPEMLRPFLRDWWERAGRPREGLVFPVRRIGERGDRVGQQRHGLSHADAFRRDLVRAFAHAHARGVQGAPRGPRAQQEGEQLSAAARGADGRWIELFEETEYTRPVDFHSSRRAFAQALADADVNAQQAAALTGHADLGAHMRYLRNAGKMRRLPDAALPALHVVEQRALAKDMHPVLTRLALSNSDHEDARLRGDSQGRDSTFVIPMLQVVGSNPIARSE